MIVQVLFRYLLSQGACPKSYGPTVARAAGVPAAVAERAVEISDSLELGSGKGSALAAFRQIWAGIQGGLPDEEALRRLQCNAKGHDE